MLTGLGQSPNGLSLHPPHGRRPHHRPACRIQSARRLASALALCLRRMPAAPVEGTACPASACITGRRKHHCLTARVALLPQSSPSLRIIASPPAHIIRLSVLIPPAARVISLSVLIPPAACEIRLSALIFPTGSHNRISSADPPPRLNTNTANLTADCVIRLSVSHACIVNHCKFL